ncbi:MAG: SIS domain-containing protein [Desulfobacterales bacterium]|nr:SIS domain-containing protein [Desulfobacterales bacterium]MDD4071730.1 SIS domain-containing protein [Desulfobacterales bacterium]MDD4391692.1 SIS domain-containing protein [Desulfobacterales bacterium]
MPELINLLKRSFFNALNGIRSYRVFIGKNPRLLPKKSIILFPIQPNMLCCGLAGIITIATGHESDLQIVKSLSRQFNRIQAKGIASLIDGSEKLASYLDGWKTLEALETFIIDLKQDLYLEQLFFQRADAQSLSDLVTAQQAFLDSEDALIEQNATRYSTSEMEQINASLTRLKDCVWALDQDILSNLEHIRYLTGMENSEQISREGFRKYRKMNLLLNSIDRLEVRGRDSAGVQITLDMKSVNALETLKKSLNANGLLEELTQRSRPGDLLSGSIHISDFARGHGALTFIYKKASVTGKLGENTAYIRSRIRSDQILQAAVNEPVTSDIYMAHTRWASVGSITNENCHPINNYTIGAALPQPDKQTGEPSDSQPLSVTYPCYGPGSWSIHAALNGDIDNFVELKTNFEKSHSVQVSDQLTTDTKIIPLQIEHYLFAGYDLKEAFRLALNDFKGSHAIAVQSNLEPGKVFLAIRGSGQSLYIGVCKNQYMFSSELYGLVELTPHFIKMDGETERTKGDPSTRGQLFILSGESENSKNSISACYYDNHPIRITDQLIRKAEITTRDIDRKGYPHFLLKEILEAPMSVKKTLRGKYQLTCSQTEGARVVFNLGDDIIPESIKSGLSGKKIRKIFVIGQGTACIAGKAIAESFLQYLKGSDISVESKTASELSGFSLEDDLSHMLVIAVTQSGTTTDTNRAVALAKERGALLIAIVNRRQSDITNVTDGVFYTSDGRDIEMSVASTKAFYSQITAGYILALYFAQLLGTMPDCLIARKLEELQQAPEKMNRVIAQKETIRASAWDIVKQKKYWAVVGSGPNKVASDEIRIKLSELCYKTISSDIVEDKKHIDLSSEPLIVVCAAGTPELVIEDIKKDVDIFKAHSAAAVVIADNRESRFDLIADSVIQVPRANFPISVIMNTLAGHIWGYYAACSIDDDGNFFREFRRKLSAATHELDERQLSVFEKITDPGLAHIINEFSSEFKARRQRMFFSSLGIDVASDMTLLLKYAAGKMPLEDFWEDFKEKRTSSSPLDMLDICLGRAIDELSRPIDAIKHQAKTVTVGTSRKVEIPKGIVFDFLGELNFSLENLSSRNGVQIRRIQKAIFDITGYTLYDIDNLDENGKPVDISTISISDRSGISFQIQSRVTQNSPLKGTKKTIVNIGNIYAGLGKSDKAPIVIIPLIGDRHVISHLLLMHVHFRQDMSVAEKIDVLGDKVNAIRDVINEYNLPWNENYLKNFSIEFFLDGSIDQITSSIIDSLNKGNHKD